MKRILVWDLLTRLFHWILATAFVGAAGIALLASHRSPLFQTHMLLGLIAAFSVVLRLIWGFVGTRYARFSSFLFGPKALVDYIRGAFQRSGERHAGHNPGSAYAIYGMLLLPLGLALTGVLVSSWKLLGDVHQILAYVLLAAVAAHIAGIVWHTVRHRENIALSMVDGKKEAEASAAIPSSHPVAGLVFLALAVGWALLVFYRHDPAGKTVTVFGQTIHLGKADPPNGMFGAGNKGAAHGEVGHAQDD